MFRLDVRLVGDRPEGREATQDGMDCSTAGSPTDRRHGRPTRQQDGRTDGHVQLAFVWRIRRLETELGRGASDEYWPCACVLETTTNRSRHNWN